MATPWIDLEGFLLEGSIEGESLQAAGELTDYLVSDEPRQSDDIGEPEVDEEEGSSQSSAGCAMDADDGEGEGVAPPCEPIDESITAFMDADIRSSTRMRGSIFVDYSFYDAYCTVEFAFEAEALEEDCDCCDDDDDYGVDAQHRLLGWLRPLSRALPPRAPGRPPPARGALRSGHHGPDAIGAGRSQRCAAGPSTTGPCPGPPSAFRC